MLCNNVFYNVTATYQMNFKVALLIGFVRTQVAEEIWLFPTVHPFVESQGLSVLEYLIAIATDVASWSKNKPDLHFSYLPRCIHIMLFYKINYL